MDDYPQARAGVEERTVIAAKRLSSRIEWSACTGDAARRLGAGADVGGWDRLPGSDGRGALHRGGREDVPGARVVVERDVDRAPVGSAAGGGDVELLLARRAGLQDVAAERHC